MIEARERLDADGNLIIEVYLFGELLCEIADDDVADDDPDAPPTIT